MIVTRTPLRITLGGGGTDLTNGSGYCIAAAINHYVTIAVNYPFTDDYILKYSSIERTKTVLDINHTLLRDILHALDIQPGIEISSMADIPGGTGLGSSGAFTEPLTVVPFIVGPPLSLMNAIKVFRSRFSVRSLAVTFPIASSMANIMAA